MTPERRARAERLGAYFEVQLRLARRMSELTGAPLGEMAFRHTNLNRRFGWGSAGDAAPAWLAYAERLEVAADFAAQVALTQETFQAAGDEASPLSGQTAFGCFAHEAPNAEGAVKIHFNNRDTDASGGPLARSKAGRRRDELAAMVAHIREAHPEAKHIAGRSWLYHLEAYCRLFPPDYVATRALAPGPLHLTGTSSWGQMIDSREAIRPDLRDAFVVNLRTLDPEAPWLAFPLPALAVSATVERFCDHYAV